MSSVSLQVNVAKANLRKRAFLGNLPPDFLRITNTANGLHVVTDQQVSPALYPRFLGNSHPQNAVGCLNVTIAQAKLVRNYGLTRMDPYVRLRVGYCVFETDTDPNGGKTPHWNKVMQCPLPLGANAIYVEIYDEHSFMKDQLIAWSHISISENVFHGETIEDWYPLNGKQGDGKEGMISLVLSYTNVGRGPHNPYVPLMMVPSTNKNMLGLLRYAPVPVYTQTYQPPALNTLHLNQIEEMFPDIDKDVVKSVYEANSGNEDVVINTLIHFSSNA